MKINLFMFTVHALKINLSILLLLPSCSMHAFFVACRDKLKSTVVSRGHGHRFVFRHTQKYELLYRPFWGSDSNWVGE